MPLSADDWVVRFAEELGTTAPDHSEFNALLGLSSIAARSSDRKAAPVACWIAARAGVTPAEAIAVARRIAAELTPEGTEDQPESPLDQDGAGTPAG